MSLRKVREPVCQNGLQASKHQQRKDGGLGAKAPTTRKQNKFRVPQPKPLPREKREREREREEPDLLDGLNGRADEDMLGVFETRQSLKSFRHRHRHTASTSYTDGGDRVEKLEQRGVVFPEEESAFWNTENPAVTFSLPLPRVDTRQGKEWTRDLGCYFVKQLKRQAVEVSDRHLSQSELEGFRHAKSKEVKNFITAKAFQHLPPHLRPSKRQILKMRWLLTWKLDDAPEGEPIKRVLSNQKHGPSY